MKFNSIKRRNFLQGIGASLALPFLPSLTPRAFAALGEQKVLITITEQHGGINSEYVFPSRNPENEQTLYSGDAASGMDHRSRVESLRNFVPNASSEFSPVLGSFLNPHLDHINVIRGLDVMFYLGHHYGAYLGNFAARAEPGIPATMQAMETIDHIIARSTQFYPSRPVMPIMNMASGSGFSYTQQSGSIQHVNTQDNWSLLNSMLGSQQPINTNDDMVRYLNLIHADYQSLVSGAHGPSRRLSSEDRNRVEEHMTLLNDLSAKLGTQGGIAGSCGAELTGATDRRSDYWPPDIDQQEKVQRWQNNTDIIVGAIKCGACRIANVPASIHPDFAGDWHQSVAHRQAGESDPEVLRLTAENSRFTAQHVFGQLVEKLNVDRGDGSTYLDNSLVQWLQECGPITHDPVEMWAITAGSAGGYFETGNYVDYRNLSNVSMAAGPGRVMDRRPGLPYNRWLYTVLKSMGIPDGDFARPGMLGYGDNYVDRQNNWFANNNGQVTWPDRLLADMSRPMPRIVR